MRCDSRDDRSREATIGMVTFDYVVTGSSGLLGSKVTNFLKESGYRVKSLDLHEGHDLTDEEFTRSEFASFAASNLVNLFAINDKVKDIGNDCSVLELSLDRFRQTLEVNVTALFSVCREFIRNNSVGNIVNFSSIYGIKSPDPSLYDGGEKPASYGVSKAAVINLSQHLAVHAAPNFRVNTIVLGGVWEQQDESFVQRYQKRVPLQRMANPEDIFGAIEFLCSEKSLYLTGSTIYVDGGWLAK
jgi:NAD(P)-dependent dehydrogenase (short-subunit alcohol dehydrogenase family)